MRLWELLDTNITPRDVKRVQARLNQTTFAPQDAVKANKPVVDLELPVGHPESNRPSHFYQRAWERDITPAEIDAVMRKGKSQFTRELDAAAKGRGGEEFNFYDPDTHVKIPVMVKPNRNCVKTQDGNPVCLAHGGVKEPKNELVAKTVIRKGEDDRKHWGESVEEDSLQFNEVMKSILPTSIKHADVTYEGYLSGFPIDLHEGGVHKSVIEEAFSDKEINDWIRTHAQVNPTEMTSHLVVINPKSTSKPSKKEFVLTVKPYTGVSKPKLHSDEIPYPDFGVFFFNSKKEALDFATLFKMTFSVKYDIEIAGMNDLNEEEIHILKNVIIEQMIISDCEFSEYENNGFAPSWYHPSIREFIISEVFSDDEVNDWISVHAPNKPIDNPRFIVSIIPAATSRPSEKRFVLSISPTTTYFTGQHSDDHPVNNRGMFFFKTQQEALDFATLFKMTFSVKYDIEVLN